jgi:membrane fusion protein (multidrug efflux system)
MPAGRDQFVLVAVPSDDGFTAERRQITIGTRRPGLVEVVTGLSAGERVVTHGTLRVRPGQAVSIKGIDDGSQPIDVLLSGAAPGGTR